MFFDEVRIAEVILSEFFNRVDCASSASQHDSFHVSAFGSSQGQNASIGEHFQANRVDSFLVNDHEGLIVALGHFILEVHYLLAPFVGKSAL